MFIQPVMDCPYDIMEARLLSLLAPQAPALDDEQFGALALELFSFQFERNEFYRRWCQALGVANPATWQDIPALPASAFKRAAIRAFDAQRTSAFFRTSGTTRQESGTHYFASLRLYEAAIAPAFEHYLMPDPADRPMLMFFLTPSPGEAPHSSLTHMMETVRKRYADAQSRYLWSGGALMCQELFASLRRCQDHGEPVFLLGTAFAFAFMIEEMARLSLRFDLPAGSRIMETGGFKGRAREIERPEFYGLLSRYLGVAPERIVNEYGMTELSSQFYDVSLRDGAPSTLKGGPWWTRVRVVDPLSGRALYGQPGLVRIWDLANLGSVIALQTEDVGIAHAGGGFEVLGRVKSAPARGCSLAAEALFGAPRR